MARSYTRVVDGHSSKLLILRPVRVLARDRPRVLARGRLRFFITWLIQPLVPLSLLYAALH